jgi:5-formyltetrahydrofolate cyclo-ligase
LRILVQIESEKRVARKRMKTTLASLDEEQVLNKSKLIGENLLKLLHKIQSQHSLKKLSPLGIYSPLRGEVDWQCVRAEISSRWTLAFPGFCEASGMKFKAEGEGLVESCEFGVSILSPAADAQELFPEVCLVPGLAFSEKGERLGRGKGFYDRYLSSFRGITIGLAFDEQVIGEVPIEAHDELIEFLVSESKIFWRGKPYEFQLNAEDI